MGLKPEETLATWIGSQVAALTLNTNLFAGPVTPDPDQGCWVIPTGGPPPERFLGTVPTMKHYNMQVRVRTNKEQFPAGRALALEVSDALIAAVHDSSFDAYLDIKVLQSQPFHLPQDDKGMHQWSQNVEAEFKE